MSSTAAPSYKALRMLLLILAILLTLGGLTLLFGTTLLYVNVLAAVFGSGSLLTALLFKYFGVFALAMGYLLYVASRDPVRYVAIIDVFAGIAIIFALIDLYALIALGLGGMYSPAFVLGRSVIRLAIAAALITMRPRGVPSVPPSA